MEAASIKLDSLNIDVLRHLCAFLDVNLREWDPVRRQLLSGRPIIKFSAVNKRIRELALPYVFKTINLPHATWEKAGQAFSAINASRSISENVRTLKLSAANCTYNQRPVESEDPPILTRQVAYDFICTLKRLSRLHTLVLSIERPRDVELFMAEVTYANLLMPQVKAVSISSKLQGIVDVCTNIESIAISGRRTMAFNGGTDLDEQGLELVAIAAKARKLRHFEVTREPSCVLFKAISESLPNLETLVFTGGFDRGGDQLLNDPTRAAKIADTRARKPLPCLRTLVLTDAIYLGLGHDAPWCGNAYHGPNGLKLAQRVQDERHKAEEMVAGWVFEALPQLENLWVGNFRCATVTEREKSAGDERVVAWKWREDSRETLSGYRH